MFKLASEKTYEDGQVIIEEDTQGGEVYVILSGAVTISKMGQGERFIISTLRAGEVFGELSFFGGFKRTATATASGEARLGIIDLPAVDSELGKLSEDVRVLMGVMTQRYKSLVDRASEYSYRASPRVERNVFLTYRDNESFIKASMIKAVAGNLSVGGLFIKTEKPYNKGEQFMLDLQLPSISETLSVSCEVAWSREGWDISQNPPGMGVKFVDMPDEDRRLLSGYVNTEMLK
ncbi:MAG: TIGR02266 family protein [Deltaproteobacteria bacterium]|nr:TIGR02266 family protein [Deltaproteobacteria bacterium]MBW2192311.1 TIGR02266 family protein [Deltaproteobacteria bacterium]